MRNYDAWDIIGVIGTIVFWGLVLMAVWEVYA